MSASFVAMVVKAAGASRTSDLIGGTIEVTYRIDGERKGIFTGRIESLNFFPWALEEDLNLSSGACIRVVGNEVSFVSSRGGPFSITDWCLMKT